MGENASRFRSRARHCRDLAKDARDDVTRRNLHQIADDLDAEADSLDAEGA